MCAGEIRGQVEDLEVGVVGFGAVAAISSCAVKEQR